LKSLSK